MAKVIYDENEFLQEYSTELNGPVTQEFFKTKNISQIINEFYDLNKDKLILRTDNKPRKFIISLISNISKADKQLALETYKQICDNYDEYLERYKKLINSKKRQFLPSILDNTNYLFFQYSMAENYHSGKKELVEELENNLFGNLNNITKNYKEFKIDQGVLLTAKDNNFVLQFHEFLLAIKLMHASLNKQTSKNTSIIIKCNKKSDIIEYYSNWFTFSYYSEFINELIGECHQCNGKKRRHKKKDDKKEGFVKEIIDLKK